MLGKLPVELSLPLGSPAVASRPSPTRLPRFWLVLDGFGGTWNTSSMFAGHLAASQTMADAAAVEKAPAIPTFPVSISRTRVP